jgi:hypothetical protein
MIAPSPSLSSDCRAPHGLWSLWDMLELNAATFYETVSILWHINGFVSARPDTQKEKISEAHLHGYRTMVERLIAHLTILNAPVTTTASTELLEIIKTGVTFKMFSDGLEDIEKTFKRELSKKPLYVIESERYKYFSPQVPLFGTNVQEKFLSTTFELDEAAKCIALGRPTASVFHLMRMMEIGVRSVARCLGIPDPIQPAERSWGAVLKKVRGGIDAKWTTTAARSTGDAKIFDDLYASLDAVKNPWRNDTMHPANKYTDDEAEHVFVAVRGFMMKLADRCDENGLPLA